MASPRPCPVAWPTPSHAQSGYQFPTGLPARPGREVPESPGQLLGKVAQPPWLRQEAEPASRLSPTGASTHDTAGNRVCPSPGFWGETLS